MSKTDFRDIFAAKPETPKTKEEITNSAARAILKEEVDERAALTLKLREARLAMEAKTPAPAPVKRRAAPKPRLRKY